MIEEASNEATADSNTRNMSDTLENFRGDKRTSKYFTKKSKDHPPFLTGSKRDSRLLSGNILEEEKRAAIVKSLSQSHLLKVSKVGIAPANREQNASVQSDYHKYQNQTADFDRRSSAQMINSNSRLFRPAEMRKKKLKQVFGIDSESKAERNPYAVLEKDVIQKSLNFLTIDEKMKYLRRDTHKTEETEKEDDPDSKNMNKLIISQIKSKRKMMEDIEHRKFKFSTIEAFDKTRSRNNSSNKSKPMFDQKQRSGKNIPTTASTSKLPAINDNTLMINTKEPLHPITSTSAGPERKVAQKLQHKQGEESLKLYLKLFDSLKKRTLEKRAQEEGPLLVFGEKTSSTASTENYPYRRTRINNGDKYLNAVSVEVLKDSFPQLFYMRDEIGTKILNAFGINDEIDEFIEWETLYGFIKVALFKEGNWEENSEFVIRFFKGMNQLSKPTNLTKFLRQLLTEHFGNLKEKEEILQFMVAQFEECRVISRDSQTVNFDRLYSAFIDKLLDPSFLVNLILNSK